MSKPPMTLSIIVAAAKNGTIGMADGLPWRLPEDLRRFRSLTYGHHVIMGRRTHESIGRLLPGRVNVIISRKPSVEVAGAVVVPSLASAISLAEASGETEAFVIGGGEIYALAMPFAHRIYLTRVHAEVAGDTFFPPLAPETWKRTREEFFDKQQPPDPSPAGALAYSFELYERVFTPTETL